MKFKKENKTYIKGEIFTKGEKDLSLEELEILKTLKEIRDKEFYEFFKAKENRLL